MQKRILWIAMIVIICSVASEGTAEARHRELAQRQEDLQNSQARLGNTSGDLAPKEQAFREAGRRLRQKKAELRSSGALKGLSQRERRRVRSSFLAIPKDEEFRARRTYIAQQGVVKADQAIVSADQSAVNRPARNRRPPKVKGALGPVRRTPADLQVTRQLIKDRKEVKTFAKEDLQDEQASFRQAKKGFNAECKAGACNGLNKKQVRTLRHETLAEPKSFLHSDQRVLQREKLILGTYRDLLRREQGQ